MEPTLIIQTVLGMLVIILVPGILLAKAFIRDIEDTAQLLLYALVLGFLPQFVLYLANSFLAVKITQTTTLTVMALCVVGGLTIIWNQRKQ